MIRDARNIPRDIAGFDPTAAAGDCMFDEQKADKAVNFFRDCLTLTVGAGAGEPFKLQPWQEDITRTIFGWIRPDGFRRFRECCVFVPRKNGKTTWIAGLAVYVLFCDAERGAQCYCGAASMDQARLLFMQAEEFIKDSGSGLDELCKIRAAEKHIRYKNSFLKAIPTNEGRAHGYNSHLIVGDELHAWNKREFYNALHTSTGARQQPLEVYITTAGYDRESLCYEKYMYAKQVRDGQIDDPKFLPVIYEAEEDDDWTDPAVWKKANPNLGVTIRTDYFEDEFKKAAQNQRYENTWRRLHLNQWTQQEVRWLSMDQWRKCKWTDDGFDDKEQVFGGLDLSSKKDVTAWALAQRVGSSGWKVRCHYFIPQGTLEEAERRDKVPYSKWVEMGYVTATPGSGVRYDVVHQHILADHERLLIGCAGYDPWNAEPTRLYLKKHGLEMHEVRQGVGSLSEPSKELERAVVEGELDHGHDPVLEWMAGNVEVETDKNGNIRPVKGNHGDPTKRVDGIFAVIMAILTAQLIEPDGPSIYLESGAGIL